MIKITMLALLVLVSAGQSQADQVLEDCKITAIFTDLFEMGVTEKDSFEIKSDRQGLNVRIGDWTWDEIVEKKVPGCRACLSEYVIGELPTVNNPKPAMYVFRKIKNKTFRGLYIGAFFSIKDLSSSLVNLACK